jgi:hypothetical protein
MRQSSARRRTLGGTESEPSGQRIRYTPARRFISEVLAAIAPRAQTEPVMSETTRLERRWPADASTLIHAVKRLQVAWLPAVAAVGLGIILRLVDFLRNRALSQDEARSWC